MQVILSAKGTPAQVIAAIGHDVKRERAAHPESAHVLYAVRDEIGKHAVACAADDTITVEANISITTLVEPANGPSTLDGHELVGSAPNAGIAPAVVRMKVETAMGAKPAAPLALPSTPSVTAK